MRLIHNQINVSTFIANTAEGRYIVYIFILYDSSYESFRKVFRKDTMSHNPANCNPSVWWKSFWLRLSWWNRTLLQLCLLHFRGFCLSQKVCLPLCCSYYNFLLWMYTVHVIIQGLGLWHRINFDGCRILPSFICSRRCLSLSFKVCCNLWIPARPHVTHCTSLAQQNDSRLR